MVLLKTALLGAFLITVGILLLTVAGPYITVQVQDIQRHDVESHAEFLVGDFTDRQYSLPASVSVFGTIDVAQAPTNQSSDVQFIVLDAANYQQWISGQQSSNIFSADEQGHSNFTFSTTSAGTYHFVFDNRASLYKKYVGFSVSFDEVSTSRQADPRTPYVGWGLLGVGLVVVVYGLIRKAPTSWG